MPSTMSRIIYSKIAACRITVSTLAISWADWSVLMALLPARPTASLRLPRKVSLALFLDSFVTPGALMVIGAVLLMLFMSLRNRKKVPESKV